MGIEKICLLQNQIVINIWTTYAEVQGIRTSTYGFVGYTISLVTADVQIMSFLNTILEQ